MLKEAFGDNTLGLLDDLRPEPRPKMWQMFDIEGMVHKEFVPPGQTVNGIFYCEVVRRLKSKHSSANVQTIGATTPGPSIMMLQLMHHSLFGRFWLLQRR
jgi:hypothetical protein